MNYQDIFESIYLRANTLSKQNEQVFGEKRDFCITLGQLEKILMQVRDLYENPKGKTE